MMRNRRRSTKRDDRRVTISLNSERPCAALVRHNAALSSAWMTQTTPDPRQGDTWLGKFIWASGRDGMPFASSREGQAKLRGSVRQAGGVFKPSPAASQDFQTIPGQGAKAEVDGRRLFVGGPALLEKIDAKPSTKPREAAERAAEQGRATIYLLEEGRVLAVFAVADAVRSESRGNSRQH